VGKTWVYCKSGVCLYTFDTSTLICYIGWSRTTTRTADERRAICECKPEAMSSGFVSGGTADAPIERSDEWLAAQKELEANRARKAAAAQQPEGRSLFETLEANKGISE
jgi:hypothetical protein